MLRDHPMQCATCTKWAHDAERCCMVCELHQYRCSAGRIAGCTTVCVLCRLRLALALQIEAHPAGNKLHPADVSTE